VRRLVALLVAVGLVVLAVVIRSGIDNGGRSGSGRLRLVCAPELQQPCRALSGNVEVTIEEPGATADRLEKASGDLGLDGWLTPGPWPEIVRDARQRAGKDPLLSVGPHIASSRIALAVWPDRLQVLVGSCPNREIGWRCVGDVAGKGTWTAVGGPPGWGAVKLGIPDPSNDATGLAALGAATVAYFARTDLSSSDLDDPGFRAWLRGLALAEADHPGLEDVLTIGRAEAAGAATLETVGGPLLAKAATSSKPVLTYPAAVAGPPPFVEVSLGKTGTDGGTRIAQLVGSGEVLVRSGWRPASPLTLSDLPSAGFLDALREAWKEAAR
jgi:hypothetical protein